MSIGRWRHNKEQIAKDVEDIDSDLIKSTLYPNFLKGTEEYHATSQLG